MFLTNLTVILVCILGVEILLAMLYVKFKIKVMAKELNKFKKNINSSVSFLKVDNGRHESWISTLATKMDALEITGKVRMIGDKNEKDEEENTNDNINNTNGS